MKELKNIVLKKEGDMFTYSFEAILDKKEKEYLEAVLKPFRNGVKYITKLTNRQNECIYIAIDSYYAGNFVLPYFDKGAMYKGMKPNKKYTLKELGLFK